VREVARHPSFRGVHRRLPRRSARPGVAAGGQRSASRPSFDLDLRPAFGGTPGVGSQLSIGDTRSSSAPMITSYRSLARCGPTPATTTIRSGARAGGPQPQERGAVYDPSNARSSSRRFASSHS
jgi:hypothetical protein